MADIQGAKAVSLVQRGGITEISHVRVFEAEGSAGATYRVIVTATGTTCSCEAGLHGRRCYHQRAAALLMAQERTAKIEPADDALWKRVGA